MKELILWGEYNLDPKPGKDSIRKRKLQVSITYEHRFLKINQNINNSNAVIH